jgi:DNA-binding NtrC family response regulator
LYYRLNVLQLKLPALRTRSEDIVNLALHFAAQYAREEHEPPISFSAEARALLLQYRWPGNVRELKNLVERFTILFPGKEIGPAELPREIAELAAEAGSPAPALEPSSLNDALATAERELLMTALRDAGGQKGRAADQLGISRHALKRRLQRLGIS